MFCSWSVIVYGHRRWCVFLSLFAKVECYTRNHPSLKNILEPAAQATLNTCRAEEQQNDQRESKLKQFLKTQSLN